MSNLDLSYFNPNKDKLYQKLTYFLIKGTTTKVRNKYLGKGMKIIGFTGMLKGGGKGGVRPPTKISTPPLLLVPPIFGSMYNSPPPPDFQTFQHALFYVQKQNKDNN